MSDETPNPNAEALRPCPFCNGEARIVPGQTLPNDDGTEPASVHCGECWAGTDLCQDALAALAAVAAWNRRAPPAEPVTGGLPPWIRAALKKALDGLLGHVGGAIDTAERAMSCALEWDSTQHPGARYVDQEKGEPSAEAVRSTYDQEPGGTRNEPLMLAQMEAAAARRWLPSWYAQEHAALAERVKALEDGVARLHARAAVPGWLDPRFRASESRLVVLEAQLEETMKRVARVAAEREGAE